MKVNFLEVSLNFNKTLASNLQSASQVLGWTGECWNWAVKSYPVDTGWGGVGWGGTFYFDAKIQRCLILTPKYSKHYSTYKLKYAWLLTILFSNSALVLSFRRKVEGTWWLQIQNIQTPPQQNKQTKTTTKTSALIKAYSSFGVCSVMCPDG